MANIAFKQGYHTYPGSSQASVAVAAGDLIVLYAGYFATTVTGVSCTDNAAGGSNAYTVGPSFADAQSDAIESFYAIAKASETLTISLSSSPSDVSVTVHVFSNPGAAVGSMLEASNKGDPGSGTSHTTPSVTTSNPNDALSVFWLDESVAGTYTDGSGFTQAHSDSSHADGSFYKIVTAGGTYQQTITSSPTTANIRCMILAFKGSAATQVPDNVCAKAQMNALLVN